MFLFLDFDGVLTSDQDRRRARFEQTELGYFSPKCIESLNHLLEAVSIQGVIVSSSHRRGRTVLQLAQMLGMAGMAKSNIVIGKTPELNNRTEEIEAWLACQSDFPYAQEECIGIVLDDNLFEVSSYLYFHHIKRETGLTKDDVALISRIATPNT